jgi:hypothetical protein
MIREESDKEEWPLVSAAAAKALATAAPAEPETRDLLRQALQDPRSAVRLAAASALWRMKAPADEVLPVLTALLNHKLASTRAGALNGLSEMGSAARPSVSEVQRLTSDENESVRRAAAEALKNITKRAQDGATNGSQALTNGSAPPDDNVKVMDVAAAALAPTSGLSNRAVPQTTHNLHGHVVPKPTNTTYIGVVELSDHTSVRVDLGAGTSCVLTPTVLSPTNVEIHVLLEELDKRGKVASFTPPAIDGRDGVAAAVSVGDICFAFTPRLKSSNSPITLRYIKTGEFNDHGYLSYGTTFWATNHTTNTFSAHLVGVEGRDGTNWTIRPFAHQIMMPLRPRGGPLPAHVLGPHEAAYATLELPTQPTNGVWRVRANLSEKTTDANDIQRNLALAGRQQGTGALGISANHYPTNMIFFKWAGQVVSQEISEE